MLFYLSVYLLYLKVANRGRKYQQSWMCAWWWASMPCEAWRWRVYWHNLPSFFSKWYNGENILGETNYEEINYFIINFFAELLITSLHFAGTNSIKFPPCCFYYYCIIFYAIISIDVAMRDLAWYMYTCKKAIVMANATKDITGIHKNKLTAIQPTSKR